MEKKKVRDRRWSRKKVGFDVVERMEDANWGEEKEVAQGGKCQMSVEIGCNDH